MKLLPSPLHTPHSLPALLALCAAAFAAPAAYAAPPSAAPDAAAVARDRARSIRLPASDVHGRAVRSYVENTPDSDYIHASETAHEAFRDIKFSVRIIWGVYSQWGIEASWPFLYMPAQKRMAYQELYKTFNPVDFDAEEWMSLFKRGGAQGFAFITKHHDGFSLFHTKTRVKRRANFLAPPDKLIEDCDIAYSVQDTPFKRDIVKELCDAGHRHGLKIDLYYSHSDWYDADFRPYSFHPLITRHSQKNRLDYGNGIRNDKHNILTPERTPEETARMTARHREQLKELLTNYGKIDMICFDMWLGKDVWPQTKETIKILRKLQPDVMFRARGIGNYGDYFQPETFIPKNPENTNMPWMGIDVLAKVFAYSPNAKDYKDGAWIVKKLIEAVAKGGSFMVSFGPDTKGRFHPKVVEALEATGRWLKVNGEGIYNTRATPKGDWKKGQHRLTRSKDGKSIYIFVQTWPGREVSIPSVTAANVGEIKMLGYEKPLSWSNDEKGGIKIAIPEALQSPANRPCEYAWCFKLKIK